MIKPNCLTVRKLSRFTTVLVILLTTSIAQAASVSYYMDKSNSLPDGTNYLQVTISDSTTVAGDIDFSVGVLTSAFSVSSGNFGIQNFSFNYDNSLSVSPSNITNLNPSSWTISENKNAGGGFGKFGFQLDGNGFSRTELLEFSIAGIVGDTLTSYTVGSLLNPSSGEFFAAHVADFDETNGVDSAQFAGSNPVPVPAALWLFGSGLLGLFGLAKLKKRA